MLLWEFEAPHRSRRDEFIIPEQTRIAPWEGGNRVSPFPVFLVPWTIPSLRSCSNSVLNEIYSDEAGTLVYNNRHCLFKWTHFFRFSSMLLFKWIVFILKAESPFLSRKQLSRKSHLSSGPGGSLLSGWPEVGRASVFLWVEENKVSPPIYVLGDPLAFLVGLDRLLPSAMSQPL